MGAIIHTVKLPSLSRVAPGAKATLELPGGPTYLRVFFVATGTALAVGHVKEITAKINGKPRMTWKDAQQLFDINAYFNRAADTINNFCLHFFRAELEGLTWKRAPGIGTADVSSFHIELQLDAAFPADGTIEAWAEIDPEAQPLGAFINVTQYPFASAVSGEVEVDKLDRGPFYSAIHLFKADVTKVIVKANRNDIVDATKTVLERQQKEASPVKRVPQTAKATHIDFCLQGDLASAYPTGGLTDWRLKMTLGTSGAVDIVTETLDVLT